MREGRLPRVGWATRLTVASLAAALAVTFAIASSGGDTATPASPSSPGRELRVLGRDVRAAVQRIEGYRLRASAPVPESRALVREIEALEGALGRLLGDSTPEGRAAAQALLADHRTRIEAHWAASKSRAQGTANAAVIAAVDARVAELLASLREVKDAENPTAEKAAAASTQRLLTQRNATSPREDEPILTVGSLRRAEPTTSEGEAPPP